MQMCEHWLDPHGEKFNMKYLLDIVESMLIFLGIVYIWENIFIQKYILKYSEIKYQVIYSLFAIDS